MGAPLPRVLRSLLVVLLAPAVSQAAPHIYEVGGASEVTFSASSSLHDFTGQTDAVVGEARFDPDDPLSATGEVRIDATTLRTGSRGRDADMHGKALHTGRYPEISFQMRRFVPDAGDPEGEILKGNIHGTLDLHGVEAKLAVPATVDHSRAGIVGVSGSIELDMRDFGIDPPRTGFLFVQIKVYPKVTVSFELELHRVFDEEASEDRKARIQERLREIRQRHGGSADASPPPAYAPGSSPR